MSEKDAILRQRLIELEKKHAKALRKLQRAERSKQRRQTFHGFSVHDENTVRLATANPSGILPSQQTFSSLDVCKPSCFSAHKKGHGKTVTFKDAVAQDALSDKRCNESVPTHSNGSKKAQRKRPGLKGSCIPHEKSKFYAATLQCNVENENVDLDVPNRNVLELASDSLDLADNKIPDDNILVTEKQDNYSDHSLESKEMPKLPTCSKEISNLELKECLTDGAIDYKVKEVENTIKESVSVHNPSAHQNSQHITKESLALLQGSITLNQADGFPNRETDNSPSNNWHWLQLFEEEFPRRSPRLRSMPNFGSQAVDSQGNYAARPSKSKPTKTRQPRAKKVKSQNSGAKTVNSVTGDAILLDNLSEERTKDIFVFPRPSLEHTKPGGPLSVVVDFSLPDKEFVKLKLAKIKSALSAEKGDKQVNDKAEGMTKKHVQEVERKSKLPDSKWTINEEKDSIERTMEQHSLDEKRDNKQLSSNGGQEAILKEECSTLLFRQCSICLQGCLMESKTEVKSKEVKRSSMTNTLKENQNEIVKELSPVTFESKKHSGCGSFSLEHIEQHDCHLMTQNDKASISSKQKSCEDTGAQTCTVCQCNSSHCKCHKFQVDCDATLAQDTLQTDDIKLKGGLTLNTGELHQSVWEVNRDVDQSGSSNSGGLTDENDCLRNSTVETEVPNQNKCNDKSSRTGVINETCSPTVTFDSTPKAIPRSPKKLNDQEEVFNLTQGKSSPLNPEPTLGNQGTPYRKMSEPLESSQISSMMLTENHTELSPVRMVACLQHHIDREDNRVWSVSLSSYEPSSEKGTSSLLQKRRDVLAVCLAHLVVIWTMLPGSQWTVLHKWSLPLDGEEEFCSILFIPITSHVVLLAGGNFYKGNGRILGYSEEGDYSLDLRGDDESKKPLFSTMCLLHHTSEQTVDKDVDFIIGGRTSHKVTLTKWSLDSFCLLVEGSQTFTPVYSDTELSSLQPVCGSHCLVLGTTDDTLFLWNHKTCQQLRSINLDTMGLGGLSCLKAITQRGFVFLVMTSNSTEKHDDVNTNAAVCSLFALNPKTPKMVCLECFCLPGRVNIAGTNGQYIAAGYQGKGKVNLWNVINSQRHTTLQVFQDEVSSVGFHQDKPLIAFGSMSGCVHLFTMS